MIPGIKLLTLQEEGQPRLDLAVVIPKQGDIWGVLAPLKETPWGDEIWTVPGEAMSHALHGWTVPLLRVLGTPPRARAVRMSEKDGRCSLHETCVMAKDYCRPSPQLPDCYEAPLKDVRAAHLATLVALAWKEGRYVLLVEGEEHSL